MLKSWIIANYVLSETLLAHFVILPNMLCFWVIFWCFDANLIVMLTNQTSNYSTRVANHDSASGGWVWVWLSLRPRVYRTNLISGSGCTLLAASQRQTDDGWTTSSLWPLAAWQMMKTGSKAKEEEEEEEDDWHSEGEC